ncbi:hypothetical protein C4579_02840 [Candidatus Microgenomates bacterium]|nr:MAG: hypothetical protein C4579_02840 [Candidatus Microgenomates bacterium]
MAQKKGAYMNFSKPELAEIETKLQDELARVEKQITELTAQDPFSDTSRLNDNAASDTEANEEMDHERFEAMIKQLKDKQASINKALEKINQGKYGLCESCGKPIEIARLKAVPTATLCMTCEAKRQKS